MNEVTSRYAEKREDPQTFCGYGLERRFRQIRNEFLLWQRSTERRNVLATVVDFGCAGGEMLNMLCDEFPASVGRSIGIDLTRDQSRWQESTARIELIHHDLSKDFPYPIEADSVDFAIVSAYLKHNPVPVSFLKELRRILKPHGRAVLLDPVPLVVRLGILLRYFDPKYTMSSWSAQSLTRICNANKIGLHVLYSHRYWIAPTRKLFDMHIEECVPGLIRQYVGLHQCVVVAPYNEQ